MKIWPYLEKRFPAAEYALLPEVRDAAGFSGSRSADAIAMGLWPSRGLELTGIEVKSFRGDWIRELKNPAKAENIFKYCDRWYLVTTDTEVAKKEEIPATWGWLAVKGAKLLTMVEAPKLTPEPMTRHFTAAMLKRACQGKINADSIEEKISEAVLRGEERGRNENSYQLRHSKERVDELTEIIDKFEKESGVKMRNEWQIGNIAKAVKFTLDGGIEKGADDLRHFLKSAESLVKHLKDGIASMDAEKLETNKLSEHE